MSTGDYAIHCNDLGIWTMMTCRMAYAVHPCHSIKLTKGCEPFDVCQWVRELTELWGEVEDSTDSSHMQTCDNNRMTMLENGRGNPGVFFCYPYPYPPKPLTPWKGQGFEGYG